MTDTPTDLPEPDSSETETDRASKPRRTCFYCDQRPDAKPFKVWLHHLERREEAYVNVPRCAKCEGRQTRHVWIGGAGVLLLLFVIVFGKGTETIAERVPFLLLLAVSLGVVFAAKPCWKWWMQRQGYPAEEHGHQYPMVQSFLEDGFQLGRFVEKLPAPAAPQLPDAPMPPDTLPKLPEKPRE
jgi:hypothetical protein